VSAYEDHEVDDDAYLESFEDIDPGDAVVVPIRRVTVERDGDAADWTTIDQTADAKGDPATDADGVHLPEAWVDAHVGEVFAEHLGDGWSYVTLWRKWMRWDSRRWVDDSTERVHEIARQWIIALGVGVMRLPGDNGDMLKKIAGYKRAGNLEAVVKVARRIRAVKPSVFDQHPRLLNCRNGVVDLSTGTITEHDPALMLTKIAGADYLPSATHPDVVAALGCMTPAVAESVQQLAGTAASGQTGADLVPVFDGDGGNGKTTVLLMQSAALGEYGNVVPNALVMNSGREEHPHLYETLRGVRLAYIEETEEDGGLRLERVKAITGGGDITARPMGGSYYVFAPTHTLTIATNHRPIVNSVEHAIWRRLKLIPFPYRYTSTPTRPNDLPIDSGLRERLRDGKKQRQAALAWIVAGAITAYENGGGTVPVVEWCDEIHDATQEWKLSEDVIGRFIATCIHFSHDARTKGTDVFKQYQAWCAEENRPAGQAKNFHRKFGEHEDVSERAEKVIRHQAVHYDGIAINPAGTDTTSWTG
jgi:putative DNA primase/helicase